MNFKYFPELGWKLGYPLFWLITVGVEPDDDVGSFRRKGWF